MSNQIVGRRFVPIGVGVVSLVVAMSNTLAVAEPQAGVQPSDEVQVPTPPRVLQNRFFVKALRPEVSVFGGTVLNEAYASTFAYGLKTGIFLNEEMGLEYGFTRFMANDSADLTAIRRQTYCRNTACTDIGYLEPSYVTLRKAHSFLFTFAPIYGKVSLRDKAIIYSDIYVTAGTSLLTTSIGNKTAFAFGLGQRFYFAKNYNVRIDALDNLYREEREDRDGTKINWRNAWIVSLGFSAFLWSGESQ